MVSSVAVVLVGRWAAHVVILVSPLDPNPLFFLFCLGPFIQLGGLLGQGLGLGPGLVNFTFFFFPAGRNVSGGFCKIFDGRAKGKQVS